MATNAARKIVVGYDGSENAHVAVDWAVANAKSGDTVVVVHSWHPVMPPTEFAMPIAVDDTYAHKMLDAEKTRIAAAAKAANITVEAKFFADDPRNTLLNEKSDLIVLGARGHKGVAGLMLGSVADYVARHSETPVVIVPHK